MTRLSWLTFLFSTILQLWRNIKEAWVTPLLPWHLLFSVLDEIPNFYHPMCLFHLVNIIIADWNRFASMSCFKFSIKEEIHKFWIWLICKPFLQTFLHIKNSLIYFYIVMFSQYNITKPHFEPWTQVYCRRITANSFPHSHSTINIFFPACRWTAFVRQYESQLITLSQVHHLHTDSLIQARKPSWNWLDYLSNMREVIKQD